MTVTFSSRNSSAFTRIQAIPTQEIVETSRQVAEYLCGNTDSNDFKNTNTRISLWMSYYAQEGVRPHKDAVLRIDTDLVIYYDVPEELRLKFLRLCGYTPDWSGTDLIPTQN
jgi:hypothetical protein